MRAALFLSALLPAAGCGDEQMNACDSIAGETFESIELLECGLGWEGEVLCHWLVSFDEDGSFARSYSDLGEEGSYDCEGMTLTDDSGAVRGSYDPEAGELIWDEVSYRAQSAAE